jgi:hypothetical protein
MNGHFSSTDATANMVDADTSECPLSIDLIKFAEVSFTPLIKYKHYIIIKYFFCFI